MTGDSAHEPRWIPLEVALDWHSRLLDRDGGARGIRDLGLIESALARPKNAYAYGETSFAQMAAEYGYGLARNHGFVDGNKRIAFAVMVLFLRVNGAALDVSESAATEMILRLVVGDVDLPQLAAWLAANIVPNPSPA